MDKLRNIWPRALLFALFVVLFYATSLEPALKCRELLVDYTNLNTSDVGLHWLFVTWLRIALWLNPSHGISGDDLFAFETVVLFFFSALMLIPDAPFMAAAGGQLALFLIWLTFGEISAYCHAIEAWDVTLGAMFIVQLAFWKGSRRDYASAALFGGVLGYFPMMRQSAMQASAACFFILGVGAVAAGVTLWRRRHEWAFRKYAWPLGIFLGCYFVVRTGAEWLWTVVSNRPWLPHGAGGILLASLGFAANPYNIVWDDDFQKAQGLLIAKKVWMALELPDVQAQIGQWWRAYVLEDPCVMLRSMLAKAGYLVRYFTGTLDARATQSDQYPISPSWVTFFLGLLFALAAVRFAINLRRCRSDRMLALAAGAAGLFIASNVSLIVVGPFYMGSDIAFCLALFLILMPASEYAAREQAAAPQFKRNTVVCMALAALAIPAVLPVAAYTGYRSGANRREALDILTGDPYQEFQALGYRFSWRFNRLSLADQQKVIDRLLSSERRGEVFSARSPAGGKTFTPILAMIAGDDLGVIAKMSRDWKMDLPSRVQGPRNSALRILKNTGQGPPQMYYLQDVGNYLKIQDASWDGRYRMFCLPEPPDFANGARFLDVGAFNFSGGSHGFSEGLVLDLISEDRLYLGGASS